MIGINRACRARPRVALLIARVASPAAAHAPSPPEWFEGGDFIAHAEQSRDRGMTREAFLAKLVDDIRLIQTFPPSLRCFGVDPEGADFLHAESSRVFDVPQPKRIARGSCPIVWTAETR